MIKNLIKRVLQKIFGFENYLYIFSLFIIRKLPWDKKEKDFLFFLRMLPNEGVLLDIGANIGVMSYYLSHFKPKAQVISFEPIAVNFQNLERILRKYKLTNVQIEKYALGEEEGEIEMVMPVVNSVKFHGLSHVIHGSIKENNEGTLYKVPIKRLDTIAQLQNLTVPVNAIKIDVENFEYFVLKGGKKLIDKYKPIIYAELWEGENRKQTFELLLSLGYKAKVVENGQLIEFEGQFKQNFIFVN
jgi:FkbM family methyltransferase